MFCVIGQIGVFIFGRGILLDVVVVDFIFGVVEWLLLVIEENYWQVIEGQGFLFYFFFVGVMFGLLYGFQLDGFIVCYELICIKMCGVEMLLLIIQQVIDMIIQCGWLINLDICCIGIVVNMVVLDDDEVFVYFVKVGE